MRAKICFFLAITSFSVLKSIFGFVEFDKLTSTKGHNDLLREGRSVESFQSSSNGEHPNYDQLSNNTINSTEKCDFHNRRLRVAVSQQPPFVECMQNIFGDWNCNGSNIEVIHVLERQMNFRSSWVVIANNHDLASDMLEDDDESSIVAARHRQKHRKHSILSNRHQTEHGLESTSSSIFGLVESGRVVMSANGVMRLASNEDTKFNVTLSEPFDSFKLHFLLSKSVYDHDHIFIKPFTLNAWLAILVSAALVVPIFYLLNTTSHHYHLEDDKYLNQISLKPHLKLLAREQAIKIWTLMKCKSTTSHSSPASFEIELEEEIGKMIVEHKISSNHGGDYSHHLPTILRSRPIHGKTQSDRRLALRQWAFERSRARRSGRKRRLTQRSGFSNLSYIIWYVAASLTNQGGETEDLPRASSTRVLIAFWWLYLIVICAIHSGILTAILTFPKQNDFIQTLDDYLNLEPSERAHLRVSVDKYSEAAHLLSNPDNLHKSPLHQLVDSSKLSKMRDGSNTSRPIAYVNFQRHRQRVLDEVQSGRAAFIEEKSTISQIISQEYFDSKETKCLFKASRYPIDVIPMSLILSNSLGSKCKDLINLTLRRIYKTGLAQKWRRMYELQGNDCLTSVVINAGDVDKIELKHVIMAFWLVSLGWLLGFISLIVEIIWLFLFEDDEKIHDTDSSSSSGESDLLSSDSDDSSTDSDCVQLGFRRPFFALPAAPGAPVAVTSSHGHSRSQAHSTLSGRRLWSQAKVIRSLQARRLQLKTVVRQTKKQQKRFGHRLPKFLLTPFRDSNSNESSFDGNNQSISGGDIILADESELPKLSAELHAQRAKERRKRRELKVIERRNRRVQKTVDFLKHLHSGRIYSNSIKARIRRMSAVLHGR